MWSEEEIIIPDTPVKTVVCSCVVFAFASATFICTINRKDKIKNVK